MRPLFQAFFIPFGPPLSVYTGETSVSRPLIDGCLHESKAWEGSKEWGAKKYSSRAFSVFDFPHISEPRETNFLLPLIWQEIFN